MAKCKRCGGCGFIGGYRYHATGTLTDISPCPECFKAFLRQRGVSSLFSDTYYDKCVGRTVFVAVYPDGKEEHYVRGIGDHGMERVAAHERE